MKQERKGLAMNKVKRRGVRSGEKEECKKKEKRWKRHLSITSEK